MHSHLKYCESTSDRAEPLVEAASFDESTVVVVSVLVVGWCGVVGGGGWWLPGGVSICASWAEAGHAVS